MSVRKKNKIKASPTPKPHPTNRHSDLDVLHICCDDVLRTMHLLSKTTPNHPACAMFGENLHQLGITLGSLDRVLRHFICDVLLSGTNLDPSLSLDSSLTQALKLSQRTPVVKRTSLLRGGVASHLFLFSLVLRKARAAIRGADVALARQNTSFLVGQRYTLGTLFGVAMVQVGRSLFKTRPRGQSAWCAAVVAGTCTWWWMTWYQVQRHVQDLIRSNDRLLYLLRVWTVVVSVVHQAQLRRATSYVQLFKAPTALLPHRSRRSSDKGHAAKSFLSLVAMPHDEDHFEDPASSSDSDSTGFTTTSMEASTTSHAPFTTSTTSNRATATATTVTRPKTETYRNLLRAAPPPTKFAFWYDDLLVDGNYISRWGIKHGLNVLYASCYVALKYVGPHHYNTVGRLLQSCLLPYYGLQPNLAASVAHHFLSTATATDIQIAWSPIMHEMAIPIALALHTRGLAVAKLHTLEHEQKTTEAYVFSARPLDELDTTRTTVLFYFFGGGFLSNLFAADIQFIATWAAAMPNVVIVCPQYSLCPFPYPLALNECETAYDAVMYGGALGFVPQQCVLSGQSAGGNLAAALTVRRVQHHRRSRRGGRGRGRGALKPGEEEEEEDDDDDREEEDHHTPRKINPNSGRPPRPPLKSPTSPTNQMFAATAPPAPLAPPTPATSFRLRATTTDMKIKGLVMWYPTLNMSQAPSPSRVLFVSDVLLPLPLTNAAAQNYCPNLIDAFDPCCSPVFADDETLSLFPSTYIMAAGLDPLLDDSVDFHTRLTRNKTPAKLKIWRGLPHGFLGMELVNSEAACALSGSLEALKEMVEDGSR